MKEVDYTQQLHTFLKEEGGVSFSVNEKKKKIIFPNSTDNDLFEIARAFERHIQGLKANLQVG